ncbi:MAG: primosomal protein N' [Erysipelotrichaceae bacterium]|nr:primosomal protein N' [Erysipelotrichaceae bacterium]MBR5049163.1 primosomal protein N' [Erysipelotrichaceae bacterium]
MRVVSVYIEHPIMQLNSPFHYLLKGEDYLARGMRVRVDFNGRLLVGFVDDVQEVDDLEAYQRTLDYQLKEIQEIIDEQPLLNEELYQLGLWMSHQTVSPAISCFQAMLPAALKPASSHKPAARQRWVVIDDEQLKEEFGSKEMLLSEFLKQCTAYRYTKYRKSSLLHTEDRQKQADSGCLQIAETPYRLTDKQQKALLDIETSEKRVILLHGLTGSGKTEIYMQLAQKALEQGRQVLILVPEISLTSMMIERFRKRFGDSIAVYHSGLNNTEKYQQYQLVRNNQARLVVGTRSAVFMPFADLGLIVLDEEHDNSYKQDSTPRYHTRDIAIRRAQYHGCKVILGSATPALESYARAVKGVYQLITLDERIFQKLPVSHLVDMNREVRRGNFIISQPLTEAIGQRLEKNQQVILLLNRRGYTPVMKCASCGEVLTCPHCDVTLSYHKDENRLVCHCCGYTQDADVACPSCGARKWRNYGIGTQRLAEEVSRLYPDARIVRMDADSTAQKDSHRNILEAFRRHEYDVLVGTQMIAKGLDFPEVTLVGIFNADGPLNRTDYRSVEMTFDLIVQASGRSGRSENEGEVYVQAYDINHYGIRLAVRQNYIAFFNNEMQYRHSGYYPPYSYMIALMFAGKDPELLEEASYKAAEQFRLDEKIRTLGPSRLLKRKDEYRYRLILKGSDRDYLLEQLWKWYDQQNYSRHQVAIQVDVDPCILD